MDAWVRLIGLSKLIGVYIMKRLYHEGRSLPHFSDLVAMADKTSPEVMLWAPQPSSTTRVASTISRLPNLCHNVVTQQNRQCARPQFSCFHELGRFRPQPSLLSSLKSSAILSLKTHV